MIIDFHTHQFPDKIAAKTVEMLAAKLRDTSGVTPCTDGTAAGLSEKLAADGVDLGVVLPVVTRPGQFDTVNECAAGLHRAYPNLLSFGGIHPDDEDVPAHVAKIAALGLKGIKIHPDYQGVFIDDPRYIRIAKEALSRGLMIVTHAGVDDGVGGEVHCPPHRAAKFLDAVYDGREPDEPRIVFAHGGGSRMFDDVHRYLAGRNVYFDLSYICGYVDADTVLRLIRSHGVQRILVGSDCPWGDPAETIAFIRALPLTDGEKAAILGENAARALEIG